LDHDTIDNHSYLGNPPKIITTLKNNNSIETIKCDV